MDKIIIVDFGSQYTQLIARRVRECQVFSVIERPETVTDNYIHQHRPKGIILSGGPASVYKADSPHAHFNLLDTPCPILGICYGFQLLAHKLGGKVHQAPKKEYGHAPFHLSAIHPLFKNIPTRFNVWMSHGDEVIEAIDFNLLGKSPSALWGAAFYRNKPEIIGVQFHPEVSHTEFGQKLFENFIINICNAKPDWKTENIISLLTSSIQAEVGNKRVVHGLSGGVDSTTLAYLLDRAIGDKLSCHFIDHDLHREKEVEEFIHFKTKFPFPCRIVKTHAFLNSLENIADGEEKREIVGKCFANYFKAILNPDDLLAHGTLYPDTIETSPQIGSSDKIKTHHNRSKAFEGLPLLEPFKFLFKDEVRKIAKALGVPEEITKRQPFPGPGLAVRIEGEVTFEKLRILREADAIFREEVEKDKNKYGLDQYFAVLQDSYAVGIRGDARHRGPVVLLVAVQTSDFMTAKFAELPWEVINQTSRRITNEIEEINRVAYSVSDKPPTTIEFM